MSQGKTNSKDQRLMFDGITICQAKDGKLFQNKLSAINSMKETKENHVSNY